MENIQFINDTVVCNKYCTKYIVKSTIRTMSSCILMDIPTASWSPKCHFLNNNKLSDLKYNEDKKLNAKLENSHAGGRVVAET